MDTRTRVIELLSTRPRGLRQVDIARTLGISRSRVSEIVKELEKAGIVERVIEDGVCKIVLKNPPVVKREGRMLKLGIIWSSEYPFIAPFSKLIRDRLGYDVDVIVYSNGLDATWDLVVGKIDLVLAPLITELYYGALTGRVKIIGGGAWGGSAVFYNPRAPAFKTASTKVSAMEVCLNKALKELGVFDDDRVYCNRGDELIKAIALNKVAYVAAWEPVATRIRRLGFKEICSCIDLGMTNCCTLAANATLDDTLISKLSRIYDEAITLFKRDPALWLNWYSMKTGIDSTILKDTIKYYEYKNYIDLDGSIKLFKEVGLSIPRPSLLKKLIYV